MKHKKTGLRILQGLAVGVSAVASYAILLRPWHLTWGASDKEIREFLLGDEVIRHPGHVATHAITIHAALQDVWPWLVQMGQSRGGFYSYTWLENLAGCEMRNADHVVPEWQSLRAGDVVWLHPQAPPLPVLAIEPERAIVLGGAPTEQQAQGIASACTWGFYLKEVDEKTTRLIVRFRMDRKPGLLSWFGNYLLLEPAHFVMERRMMLGIKQRAESAAAGFRNHALAS